jgi:hypothetical protein
VKTAKTPDLFSLAEPLINQGMPISDLTRNVLEASGKTNCPIMHIAKSRKGLLIGIRHASPQDGAEYVQILQSGQIEKTVPCKEWSTLWRDHIIDNQDLAPHRIGLHIPPGAALADLEPKTQFSVLYSLASALIHGNPKQKIEDRPEWKGWGTLQNRILATLDNQAPAQPFDPFNL